MIRSKASIPLPAVPSALLGDSKATKLVANQHKSVVSAQRAKMHNHMIPGTAAFTVEVARILLEREMGHLRESNSSDTIINQLKGYKKPGALSVCQR